MLLLDRFMIDMCPEFRGRVLAVEELAELELES